MSHRSESTLGAPPEDISGFPTVEVGAATPWYRVHSVHHDPRYFSWYPGRFNLSLPRGTLNLASSPHTGLREFLGATLVGARLIPESLLHHRIVSVLRLSRENVAHFSAPEAPSYGVVETDMMAPQSDEYRLTQQWASALDEAGLSGIIARARFGTSEAARNFYVFGDAGEQQDACTLDGASEALNVARSLPGIRVVKTPHSKELKVEGCS